MIATMLLLLLAPPVGPTISLFDGKTLAGWAMENTSSDKVAVKDGVIRFEQGWGWLRSTREFKDFVLRLEFRFLKDDANSGIFIRSAATSSHAPAADGVDRGWPDDGYAVQLREIASDSRTATRSPLPGRLMTFSQKSPPSKELSFDADLLHKNFKPVGQWQTYEIQCVGSHVTVKLNGVLLGEGEVGRPSGYIGLQGEVGIVEYRNISVQEVVSK